MRTSCGSVRSRTGTSGGAAGWSYADWEGVVYPRKKPRGFHALAYLAEHFDLVEINSSFYSVPRDGSAGRSGPVTFGS